MMWRFLVIFESVVSKINKVIVHIFRNIYAYLFIVLLIFVICQRIEIKRLQSSQVKISDITVLQRKLDSLGELSFKQIKEVLGNQVQLLDVVNKSYERLNLVQKVLYEVVKKEPVIIFKVDTVVVESLTNKILIYYFSYDGSTLKWEGINPKGGFVVKDAYKISKRPFEAFSSEKNLVLKIKRRPIRFFYYADLGLYISKDIEPLASFGLGVDVSDKKVGLVLDPTKKRLGIALMLGGR